MYGLAKKNVLINNKHLLLRDSFVIYLRPHFPTKFTNAYTKDHFILKS